MGGPKLKDCKGDGMMEHLYFERDRQLFIPEVKPIELPEPELEKATVPQISLCNHWAF
jgi:hypothetical protein